MKAGEIVHIMRNISGHNIPIGTALTVLSVTDDEFQVLWEGRMRWITDDDVWDCGKVNTAAFHVEAGFRLPMKYRILEWVANLLRNIQNKGQMGWHRVFGIPGHRLFSYVERKNTTYIGVITPTERLFKQFVDCQPKNRFIQYRLVSDNNALTGMHFDKIVLGYRGFMVSDETIMKAKKLHLKPNKNKRS